MPIYRTLGTGDDGVMPPRATRRELAPDEIDETTPYAALTKAQLIALCDERGIKSPKGTQVGRFQLKAYYVNALKLDDKINANRGG
jgi:hypothetical protein